jgi:predicted short-subunit dehydrogenase-like oxidoreductase (DUF2520 family)
VSSALPAGLIAAGSISNSWMVRWRSLRRWLGPVLSFDTRVTARATSILRAGTPADDFSAHPHLKMVIISVPDERLPETIDGLLTQPLDWPNLNVVLCDSELDVRSLERLTDRGAATATVCQFHEMDVERLLAEGHPRALTLMRKYLEGCSLRLLEVDPGAKPLYLAALNMLGLSFPLLAASIELMRRAGFSNEMAVGVTERTVHRTTRSAKSGKKGLSGHLVRGRRAAIEHHLQALESVNPQLKDFYVESSIQALKLLSVNQPLMEELNALRQPRAAAASA